MLKVKSSVTVMINVLCNWESGWHRNQEGKDSVTLEDPKLSYLGCFLVAVVTYICLSWQRWRIDRNKKKTEMTKSSKVSVLVK